MKIVKCLIRSAIRISYHSNFVLSIVRWHVTLNVAIYLDASRCAMVLFSELSRFKRRSRTFNTLKSLHLCRGGVHFCDEWTEIKSKRYQYSPYILFKELFRITAFKSKSRRNLVDSLHCEIYKFIRIFI